MNLANQLCPGCCCMNEWMNLANQLCPGCCRNHCRELWPRHRLLLLLGTPSQKEGDQNESSSDREEEPAASITGKAEPRALFTAKRHQQIHLFALSAHSWWGHAEGCLVCSDLGSDTRQSNRAEGPKFDLTQCWSVSLGCSFGSANIAKKGEHQQKSGHPKHARHIRETGQVTTPGSAKGPSATHLTSSIRAGAA